MTSSGTVVRSFTSRLAAPALMAGIAVVAIVMVNGGNSAAGDVAPPSEPTPSAQKSDAPATPQPQAATSNRQAITAVGSAATGVPAVPSPATTARPDPLPASIVRDAVTGVPYPKRTTAESLEPAPGLLPPGGSSNGVVTDPATGVTRVQAPGAAPGR
jgi:hypothetical protein